MLEMNPIWNAIAREAAVAAEHLASGVTILGQADYAHIPYYGQAFFLLSAGFERAAKLAIAIDQAIINKGRFPSNEELRKYGHNLIQLLDQSDLIAERRGLTGNARLPRTEIHSGIITVLNNFASNITHYYDLNPVIGNPRTAQQYDPIKAWFQLVVTPVLNRHYTSGKQERHRRKAQIISDLMQPFAIVQHTSELGESLETVFDVSLQTSMAEFAKPYVRMYLLQLVRYVGRLLSELGYDANEARLETVPCLSEFFALFNNDDKYFFQRKTWSIYKL